MVSRERPRKILFVEDHTFQRNGVIMALRDSPEWQAIVCPTPEDALARLDELLASHDQPAVISVDLGLADRPVSPERGLQLLKHIRARMEGLNVVVHSTQVNVEETTVRAVVALGASYIYLSDRGDVEAYAALLPFVAQGYLVYSPSPAARLSRYLAADPDPFPKNPESWTTARLLADGLSYAQIAARENVEVRTITLRVRTAAQRLQDLGEIKGPEVDDDDTAVGERYKPLLIQWYKNNRFRDPHHIRGEPKST